MWFIFNKLLIKYKINYYYFFLIGFHFIINFDILVSHLIMFFFLYNFCWIKVEYALNF